MNLETVRVCSWLQLGDDIAELCSEPFKKIQTGVSRCMGLAVQGVEWLSQKFFHCAQCATLSSVIAVKFNNDGVCYYQHLY